MFRFMISFMTGAVAALILLAAFPETLRADEDDARQLIVMVEGDLGYGAGIIIGSAADRLYIATANHVVHDGPRRLDRVSVRLMYLPGQVIEAEVLSHFDRNLDLAVISVAGIEALRIQFDEIPLQQLGSSGQLVRGDEVFTIGNPRGMPWQTNVTPDRISRLDVLHITFESLLVGKGHSGGGLFNKNWGLVGMITADQPPNGIALRIDRVLEKMRLWGYPVNLVPNVKKAVVLPQTSPRDRIMTAFKSGKTCTLQIYMAHTSCLGKIARGTRYPYSITYRGNGNWEVWGFICNTVYPTTMTLLSGGVDPVGNAFNFWGLVFDIDNEGYARARKDKRVGGQISCS